MRICYLPDGRGSFRAHADARYPQDCFAKARSFWALEVPRLQPGDFCVYGYWVLASELCLNPWWWLMQVTDEVVPTDRT